jgi:hypothetical protein
MPRGRGVTGGMSPTPAAMRRATRSAVASEQRARAEAVHASAQSSAAGAAVPSVELVGAAQQPKAGVGGVADPNPHQRGSAGCAALGVDMLQTYL